MHINFGYDKLENQRHGSSKTKYHHEGQRFDQYRRICLLQSGKFSIRLLSSTKFQYCHRRGNICDFKKYMWPIRPTGFALKTSVNIGRHRKAGRSICLRMGCRCKIFFI